MGRYLVVARQTAESAELGAALTQISTTDPNARFVLLVPATSIGTMTEGQAKGAAEKVAARARDRLTAQGAKIEVVLIGDADPIYAVKDAFIDATYDRVIVSTLHHTVSKWLRADAVARLRRSLNVPVDHVEGSRARK